MGVELDDRESADLKKTVAVTEVNVKNLADICRTLAHKTNEVEKNISESEKHYAVLCNDLETAKRDINRLGEKVTAGFKNYEDKISALSDRVDKAIKEAQEKFDDRFGKTIVNVWASVGVMIALLGTFTGILIWHWGGK